VRLYGPPVDREGDVAERLSAQELVERLSQFLRVVHPSQTKVLAAAATATADRTVHLKQKGFHWKVFNHCAMNLNNQ
jgi:hypothetical protein